MQIILSNCCQSEIMTGTRNERPLGPKEYNAGGINYAVHTCSKCEQECCEQEYSVCDYCGEIDSDLDPSGYCRNCVLEELL